MNRRRFLGALAAIPIPVAIIHVAEDKKITDLEKAVKVDCNFDSPFLYVEARENIKAGDIVKFEDITPENPYRVAVYKNSLGYVKPAGVATISAVKGQWFLIQTVGHVDLNNIKK